MNLEDLLNRFTHNVESIIQWLFLFILALSGFLISRWLLFKKSDDGGSAHAGGPSPEISGVLQQILERTAKLDSANVQPLSPEQVALAQTQVDALKKELASREDELKALKAAGTSGAAGGEADKLQARLKELEAKLAEYEILEDDIADLSLYKEENVRLRSELDKLKNGGGAAAPAPAAAAAAPTPPVEVAPSDVEAAIAAAGGGAPPTPTPQGGPVPEGHDIVAEFASAVNADPIPAKEMTMQVPDTGNPMKDFEAAVQIEQKMKGTAPIAPAPAPAPAAAAPAAAAEAPAPAAAQAEADDLFAEFKESPAADIESGSLDTDKMMAEMAALVSLDPAAGSSLDEGIDIDKMAFEATGTNQKR